MKLARLCPVAEGPLYHWWINPRRRVMWLPKSRSIAAARLRTALVLRADPARRQGHGRQALAHIGRPIRNDGDWSCAIRVFGRDYVSHGVDAERALTLAERLVRHLLRQNGFRVVERYRITRFGAHRVTTKIPSLGPPRRPEPARPQRAALRRIG